MEFLKVKTRTMFRLSYLHLLGLAWKYGHLPTPSVSQSSFSSMDQPMTQEHNSLMVFPRFWPRGSTRTCHKLPLSAIGVRGSDSAASENPGPSFRNCGGPRKTAAGLRAVNGGGWEALVGLCCHPKKILQLGNPIRWFEPIYWGYKTSWLIFLKKS